MHDVSRQKLQNAASWNISPEFLIQLPKLCILTTLNPFKYHILHNGFLCVFINQLIFESDTALKIASFPHSA